MRSPIVRLLAAGAVALSLTACAPGIPGTGGAKTTQGGAASAPASQAVAGQPPHAVQAKGIRVDPDVQLKSGAPTVVLYQDYQCPACKSLEEQYGPALRELSKAGDIRFEIHTLTFLDTMLKNEQSKGAAVAAACADKVGRYGDAVAKIYAMQPAHEGDGWTEAQLTQELPSALGLDAQATHTYVTCYQGKEYLEFVKKVDKNANAELVNAGQKVATPQILVNGKALNEKLLTDDPASIKQAIEGTK